MHRTYQEGTRERTQRVKNLRDRRGAAHRPPGRTLCATSVQPGANLALAIRAQEPRSSPVSAGQCGRAIQLVPITGRNASQIGRTAKFGTGLRPTPENETGPAPSAAAVLAPRSARRQDVQLRLRWRPIGARSVVLLGAGKPFAKFDSGLYEHPRLLPGARVARSGARISDFPIRSPRRSHGGDHGPDA